MRSDGSPPFVSVVVPVLNGASTIGDCIASILRMSYAKERREVIVVDNGSTDRTREIVRRFGVDCVIEGRRGRSHARNRGIAASSGDVIAFTDADCSVSTGWLDELVSGFDAEDVAAVTGEVVGHPPRTAAERYVAIRKPRWSEWTRWRARPWFLFGNAAVRLEVFDALGGFDTDFSGGAEDIDFSWRFLGAGFARRHRPRAVVFHRHRTSAVGLFRQNIGYGRGQAMLHRKYDGEMPWEWRHELRAWDDLGQSLWLATKTCALAGVRGRRFEPDYSYFDFVRKLGQRVGFARGLIETRRVSGRGAPLRDSLWIDRHGTSS